MATPPIAAAGAGVSAAGPPHGPPASQPHDVAAPGGGTGQELVPAPRPAVVAEDPVWSGPVARLPVEMDVAVPVREFRLRDLLALGPGEVIESQWNHGNDVPLAAGDVALAWCEFEVVEAQLAVRVTRLA